MSAWPFSRAGHGASVWLLGVAFTFITTSACDGTVGAGLSVPNASRPKLLYAPTEEPTGTKGLTYVRDHIAELEALPFDGTTLDVGIGDGPWGTTQYTRAQFDEQVALLRSIPFARFTDNFEMFNSRGGGIDWFDDQAFAVILANARVAAEVVRDGHLRGIFFDVEQHGDPVWSYPLASSTMTLAAYEAQARKRGGEFMRALLGATPELTVILSVSYSEVFRAVCLAGQAFATDAYRLLPAFIDGMFEARAAAGAPALIVDGFMASFASRDPRSFPVFRELILGNWEGVQARWIPGIQSYRLGSPTTTWDMVPTLKCDVATRSKLTRDMPGAFGVMMDFDWMLGATFHRDSNEFDLNFFSPDALAATVTAALGSAERYVYLWSSGMDWFGASSQPRPPQQYVDAVARARQ